MGKQEARGSSGHSDTSSPNANGSSEFASAKNQQEQQSGSSDSAETVYSKVKSAASSKVSPFFQKIKEAKPVGFAKKGYDIILDELKGSPPGKRKHLEYSAPIQETSSNFERSTRTDVVVLPSKQSKWNKEWETFKEKVISCLLYPAEMRVKLCFLILPICTEFLLFSDAGSPSF